MLNCLEVKLTFIEKYVIILLVYRTLQRKVVIFVYYITKREFFLIVIAVVLGIVAGSIAAWNGIQDGTIALPEPQFSLIDERVTAKDTYKVSNLQRSAHTESVLAAVTVTRGYRTEIRSYYQLNNGEHFYHTVMDFMPGEGDDPGGKSILQYNISHALSEAVSVRECSDLGLDPKIAALIITWYVPVEDGYTKFSLMDVDGNGEWDLLANEGIKFAHNDEKGANLVSTDVYGNKIYAEYERAMEISYSNINYVEAMELWFQRETEAQD